MFRFLSGNKRPVSPFRVSFRPQLEILEGRDLPSGFVAVSQDLAPQTLFQSPAQSQSQVQPTLPSGVVAVSQDLLSGRQDVQNALDRLKNVLNRDHEILLSDLFHCPL
jgi:hypothetical protein